MEENITNPPQQWSTLMADIEIVLEKFPLKKTIKWGIPVYTYMRRNIVGLAGFKHHFALWFYNGVFHSDPEQVLQNAQKKKTKSLRQWRFLHHSSIDPIVLANYIQEAIQIEEQGLRWIEEPKELDLDPILEQVMRHDTNFSTAFEKFSLAKRNEFNSYILEAKQLQTKQRRVEKVKNLALCGQSLNEKYKKKK